MSGVVGPVCSHCRDLAKATAQILEELPETNVDAIVANRSYVLKNCLPSFVIEPVGMLQSILVR